MVDGFPAYTKKLLTDNYFLSLLIGPKVEEFKEKTAKMSFKEITNFLTYDKGLVNLHKTLYSPTTNFDNLWILINHVEEVELRNELLKLFKNRNIHTDNYDFLKLIQKHKWIGKGGFTNISVFHPFEKILTKPKNFIYRMHNKFFIIDKNSEVNIGGRNLSDSYFNNKATGYEDTARHYQDLNIRVKNSEIAKEMLNQFNETQNEATPILKTNKFKNQKMNLFDEKSLKKHLANIEEKASTRLLKLPQNSFKRMPTFSNIKMVPLFNYKNSGDKNYSNSVFKLFESTAQVKKLCPECVVEIFISNAYVMNDTPFVKALKIASENGVKIKMMTNGLTVDEKIIQNVLIGHSREWLKFTDEVYTFNSGKADVVHSKFYGVKVITPDAKKHLVFSIGSLNLDPRSRIFDSQNGILAYSGPENSFFNEYFEKNIIDKEFRSSTKVTEDFIQKSISRKSIKELLALLCRQL
ncbi:MAG: phospholipase D-like domain-containing protein [Bacteriovoracaceae bacterium]